MSESVNSNGRSSRRKPLKTTRILAEVDEETSGTESCYAAAGDGLGLRDKLLSDYVSGNTEHRLRSASQTSTDTAAAAAATADDSEAADGDSRTDAVVISSSPSSHINSRTSHQQQQRVSAGPGRPPKTEMKVDSGDSSALLPIDEYNVGLVLEKLLAMMQSMSMLLSALKNDLRHCSVPEVVAKKRDAATMQLWRAFMTYEKSFAEIEQFAMTSKTGAGQLATKKPASQCRGVNQRGRPVSTRQRQRGRRLQVRETDVIELSESETDDETESKRARCDDDGTAGADVELATAAAVILSSSESSVMKSAAVPVDAASDTSASCVCVGVDSPTKSPLTSDVDDASKSELPESAVDSEPLCDSDTVHVSCQ